MLDVKRIQDSLTAAFVTVYFRMRESEITPFVGKVRLSRLGLKMVNAALHWHIEAAICTYVLVGRSKII